MLTSHLIIVLLVSAVIMMVVLLVVREENTCSVLRRMDRRKRDEIAITSHQLRTPLTSIKWYAEMLGSNDFGKLSDEQQEFVQKVNEGITKAIELVNHSLETARLEHHQLAVRATRVEVVSALRSIIDTFKDDIRDKEHVLNFDPPAGMFEVRADGTVLEAMFHALLSNAITYTPPGGTINVALKSGADGIVVTVQDSGIGIPKEEQGKIFQPCYRAEKAKLLSPMGNGLGLHLIRTLLKEMGGTISFDSHEGKGTTFTMILPRAT